MPLLLVVNLLYVAVEMTRRKIFNTVGALLCFFAWASVGWAWMTHLEWKRTGDYSRNSLPMNRVARDCAVGASCLTALIIGLSIWTRQRSTSENPKL